MPADLHEDITLQSGDDWLIPGVLTDVNGQRLDLTGVDPSAFEWVLLDSEGEVALNNNSATITIDDPATAGQIFIAVPKERTALLPDRYMDGLRVNMRGAETILWKGSILVDASPFLAAEGL